jgi:hypothetical protein
MDDTTTETTTQSPETPKRRPGAPKGNRNALKTGLHTAEVKDLRRRLRAWRRRADAAIAAGNRLARAKTEAEREKARAEVRAAARGVPVFRPPPHRQA